MKNKIAKFFFTRGTNCNLMKTSTPSKQMQQKLNKLHIYLLDLWVEEWILLNKIQLSIHTYQLTQ